MTHPNRNSSLGAGQAFGWGLINSILSKLGTLGIGIVLARLLGPESFGTYAVALVALAAILSFNELGVSLAVVRWPSDPARIIPTVNTVSVLGSALFCMGAAYAAPYFSAAMGDPEATDVVRVLIISVFISGVVASPAALLQREFKEKTRMGIDQANAWVGAILSLLLAAAGLGPMALALGRLAGSAVSAVMFLSVSPLPYRFGFDRKVVGPLLRFGLPLAGTSIIYFAVAYADQLTAGAVLGATGLAYYILAFNLSNFFISIISQPLRRVAPAVFSALQHDGTAMNSAWTSATGLLAAAILPPAFFVASVSELVVEFIYGAMWTPAAAALAFLVLAAAIRLFTDLAYDFLVVLGQSAKLLGIQILTFLLLLPALAAGTSIYGLAGLAGAQVAVSCCVLLPLYLRKLIASGVSMHGMWSTTKIPFFAALGVGIATQALAHWLPEPLWVILCGGITALTVSAFLIYRRRTEAKALHQVGSSDRLLGEGDGEHELV